MLELMMPLYSNPRYRVLGLLVLIFLMADVALKDPADREEVMWACYWAAASVGVGMLIQSARLIAAGAIFLAGLGVPAWSVSVLMDGKVAITSILMHLIPLTLGLYVVSRVAEVPKHSATLAWLLFGVPFALAWQFCDPGAMINLSHWTRWPIPELMPNTWLFYVVVLAGSAGMIWLAAFRIQVMVNRNAEREMASDAKRPGDKISGPLVQHRP